MVVRPATGGMLEHVGLLSRGLVAAGREVEIAAPPASDVATQAHADGLTVHEIALVGPLDPVRDLPAVRALGRVITEGSFDLVHAHGFKAGLITRMALPRDCPPLVVTVHNHVLSRDDMSATRRSIYRAVERTTASRVSQYIAVSESIRRELIDGYGLNPEQVTVVRNGVDTSAFLREHDRARARSVLGIPDRDPVVGLAARFAAQKGLRHLVAAAPALIRAVPSIRIVIGGSGPLEGELREQATALGVIGSIMWPGRVTDMPSFLSALDVYVSPAETEAFGIALIEAAASGIPTVATDVGGVPEVVLDGLTGLLVPPRDPAALAEAVLRLLREPELASRLADAARKRAVIEFDPHVMVASTLAVYQAQMRSPHAR